MCTRQEVQDIVAKVETRLEKRIEDMEKHQNTRLEQSHLAVADTVSAFGEEIKKDREQMREYISLKFDPILAQVTKTNGRVTFNEKMIWLAMGAIIILAPIFSWFILDYIEFKQNLSDKISESVETALGNYEFEISK